MEEKPSFKFDCVPCVVQVNFPQSVKQLFPLPPISKDEQTRKIHLNIAKHSPAPSLDELDRSGSYTNE